QDRLLRNDADRAALLDLYRQVRSGKRIPLDDTNPLVDLLRLSGIARPAGRQNAKGKMTKVGPSGAGSFFPFSFFNLHSSGTLAVRNRIYRRAFDAGWVQQHMPDAELRRQRAAFRRGVFRTAAVAASLLAIVGGLSWTAVSRGQIAEARLGRMYVATGMRLVD